MQDFHSKTKRAAGAILAGGLRKRRSEAKETGPVLPVEDATVEATIAHLPPIVADMVRLQRLTGCRPDEVCRLRPDCIDTTGEVWAYRPESHKTQHKDRARVIFIGPRGQDILRPYLLREKSAYCFSPYDTASYRRAILSACELAFGMPQEFRHAPEDEAPEAKQQRQEKARAWRKKHTWAPNQLRHSATTEIRKRFGLEAAQAALGHATASTTHVLAAHDLERAAAIMREVG